MAEYWEPIRDRGNDTNAVWNQFNPAFKVGALTLTDHQADVALFAGKVQLRDDAEDAYDEAIDAKDLNLQFLQRMNVRAVGVLRGNLAEGDSLLLELDDVAGMPNVGSGKTLARSRKLTTVWTKVNAMRVALTPPLATLTVGATNVEAVSNAITGHEPLLKAVAEKQSAWSATRSDLKKLATRVDTNNKRWFEAWSNDYDEGTPEHDALSQIDTGPGAVDAPGPVDFTVMYDGNGKLHIDAEADHATHFRMWRKAPGEDVFIERAANATSPIDDPVSLPGVYDVKLQARNSTDDGPESAVKQVTVPG
jgi:hypothetical protein